MIKEMCLTLQAENDNVCDNPYFMKTVN